MGQMTVHELKVEPLSLVALWWLLHRACGHAPRDLCSAAWEVPGGYRWRLLRVGNPGRGAAM